MIADHQRLGGSHPERSRSDLEEAWVRLLTPVLERERERVDEVRQAVVFEVRPQIVMDVAHDADAHPAGLQRLQNPRRIRVGHAGSEVSVALPDGERQLLIEPGQPKLEQRGRSVQIERTVGVPARGDHLRVVCRLSERAGQGERFLLDKARPMHAALARIQSASLSSWNNVPRQSESTAWKSSVTLFSAHVRRSRRWAGADRSHVRSKRSRPWTHLLHASGLWRYTA